MAIFGVDPGHNFTGVAWFDPIDMTWDAQQFAEPRDASDWIDDHLELGDLVVVEDYYSSGHLTKEAKTTVKVLGYFEYHYQAYEVKVVAPQRRKSSVRDATKLVQSRYPDRTVPQTKDAIAALAHALAEYRGT